jgi:hypothetical protein
MLTYHVCLPAVLTSCENVNALLDRVSLPPRNLVATLVFGGRLDGRDEPRGPVWGVNNLELFLELLVAPAPETAKVAELL